MGVETAFHRGYIKINGKRVNFYPRILEKPKVGRKVVVHDFIYSNSRYVEDMGKSAPIYNLKVEIQETSGFSYKRVNKLFTQAIETAGICVLSHPTEGRKNVVIVDANQTQDIIAQNGIANWNISFFEASLNNFPQTTAGNRNLLNRISDNINAFSEAALGAIDSFVEDAEIFFQAKDTLEDITGIIGDAVGTINGIADEISSFVAEIQIFENSITQLLLTPTNLGIRFTNLFGAMSQVTDNFSDMSDVSYLIFGQGKNRDKFNGNSSVINSLRTNNQAVYNVVDAQCLTIACLSSANIGFESQEQVQEYINRLNKAFNSIDVDNFDEDLYYELQNMIIATKQYLDTLRISLPFNVSITTNSVPAMVLAYKLYGDGRRADEIVSNNFIEDPAFVSGTINVLSE
jgi:prophage DNA circulation protein